MDETPRDPLVAQLAALIDQVAIDYASRESDIMPSGDGLARAILAAGWRPLLPPLQEGRRGDDLNELLGIDDVGKRFTEANLIDSYVQGYDVARRERGNETVRWGYRRVGEGDDLIRKCNPERAEEARHCEGFEAVYRVVGPWKVDED